MIVVDASVVVKWFVPEPNADKAEEILHSDQRLLAPELIRIEVAATFTRLLRMNEIDIAKTQLLLDKWRLYLERQAISLEKTLTHLPLAEELSMTLKHPLQDCFYLAVARRFKVPLVTADQKLLKKVASTDDDVRSL